MECSVIPAKTIATCFALIAFAAALTVGLAVGNAAATCLMRALVTMLVCWPVGFAVGSVAQHVNERTIEEYKKKNPISEALDAPASAANPDQAAPARPQNQERKPAPAAPAQV
jgi:hypothetical protein